jgi:hypothetical protein
MYSFFNKKYYFLYLKKREVENMLLGPDRCNGPSRYMVVTLPPSLLRWSKGSTIIKTKI